VIRSREHLMRDVVTEYYEAVHEHDWVKLSSTLSDDVIRVGIRSDFDDDTVRGKDIYLRFCRTILSSFEYHTMEIIKVFYSADGRYACAETVETVQEPGKERMRLHCLKWHEIDEKGLIVRIDQYRKASSEPTPSSITVGAVLSDRLSPGSETVPGR
jgi:hypothetical protein